MSLDVIVVVNGFPVTKENGCIMCVYRLSYLLYRDSWSIEIFSNQYIVPEIIVSILFYIILESNCSVCLTGFRVSLELITLNYYNNWYFLVLIQWVFYGFWENEKYLTEIFYLIGKIFCRLHQRNRNIIQWLQAQHRRSVSFFRWSNPSWVYK